MVQLGDKIRDRINGFTGICTGRSEFIFGCVQVLVAPLTVTPEGKHPDSVWLDEARVEVVAKGALERPGSAPSRSGGPQSVMPTAK